MMERLSKDIGGLVDWLCSGSILKAVKVRPH